MAQQSVLRRGLGLVRRQVRLHPRPFAVSVFGAALFAACTVLSTVVLGRVTDDIVLVSFESGTVTNRTLAWGVVAIVVVALLRIAGVVMRRYYAGMTSARVQVTLQHRLVDQYLSLPMSWHQRTPAGQLLAHADNDTEMATEVLHPLPFSLGVAFLAVFSAISLVLVDPLLALVAFTIFPILMVLNKIYSDRVEKPAAKVQEGVGVVSSIAHESFDGALVVKTLGRADDEVARFDVAAQQLNLDRRRVGYLRAAFEPVLDALPNIGIVVVIAVGLQRVDAGAVRPGELVQVASLFSVLAFPMRVFGFFLEMMPPSVVAHDRIASVLTESQPEPIASPQHLPDGPLSLEVSGLGFGYDEETPVVSDVSFRVAAGETVALVSSTGEGKSTIAQLVAGLVEPAHGQVLIGGVPIERVPPSERVAAVSLVFQESFLFADTVRANIDVVGDASDDEVRRAAAIGQADGFVGELVDGYDTVVGERGITLSGGQRQRIALARALLRGPRLLLLDDATSAVDARIEQAILEGLRTELHMTTLVVAQRVSTIELANRVIYLSEGRIVAEGTHHELLEHPGYRALVTAYEEAAA